MIQGSGISGALVFVLVWRCSFTYRIRVWAFRRILHHNSDTHRWGFDRSRLCSHIRAMPEPETEYRVCCSPWSWYPCSCRNTLLPYCTHISQYLWRLSQNNPKTWFPVIRSRKASFSLPWHFCSCWNQELRRSIHPFPSYDRLWNLWQ